MKCNSLFRSVTKPSSVNYSHFLDTFVSRFSLRHCDAHETLHYTAFKCIDEPLYLLSRKCSNEYYGSAGPCCKVDDILNYLVNEQTEPLLSEVKYVFHCDDDTFFRGDQIMKWLESVEKAGISHFPIVANMAPGNDRNGGVWHIKECREIQTQGWYQPLMLNRAALLKLKSAVASYGVTDVCKTFGVTHDVGFGPFAWMLELFHISIPNVALNGGHLGYAVFQPDQMIVHCVKIKKEENCLDGAKWPAAYRFLQKFVVGCGEVNRSSPLHNPWGAKQYANMYDAWNYFKANGTALRFGVPGSKFWESSACRVASLSAVNSVTTQQQHRRLLGVAGEATSSSPEPGISKLFSASSIDMVFPHSIGRYYNGLSMDQIVARFIPPGYKIAKSRDDVCSIPQLYRLWGYNTTRHSRHHDMTKNWAAFALNDCNPPGSVAQS